MLRRPFVIALVLWACTLVPCLGQDTYQQEADRLAALLNWHAGSVVADLGAGEGQLTLAAAKRVGKAGRVYSTEIDPQKLADLKQLAAKEQNVTVLEAGEADTNLPPGCCDSLFLRLVYHHLTKPAEIDASLLRSLKPGGLLGIIDREPPPGSSVVKGVPANRGGHGMPQKILIEELTAAGFQLVQALNDWPDNQYCVVFRKPAS